MLTAYAPAEQHTARLLPEGTGAQGGPAVDAQQVLRLHDGNSMGTVPATVKLSLLRLPVPDYPFPLNHSVPYSCPSRHRPCACV